MCTRSRVRATIHVGQQIVPLVIYHEFIDAKFCNNVSL